MILNRNFTEEQREAEVTKAILGYRRSTMIFVFGSNYAGHHGSGAAKFAKLNRGAILGRGWGLCGNSWAIPTKDWLINTLPLQEIRVHIIAFKTYAVVHPEFTFEVTRIGCGFAGYKDKDIAPMFIASPDNCHFYEEWEPWVDNKADLGPSPKS